MDDATYAIHQRRPSERACRCGDDGLAGSVISERGPASSKKAGPPLISMQICGGRLDFA